jgi:hypothetical protein
MTLQDFISSPVLSKVIIELNVREPDFKEELKQAAPSIIADIESAAVNANCSCRGRVEQYIGEHTEVIGTLLHQYAITNNKLDDVMSLFSEIVERQRLANISGRVAKTTVKDWAKFAENINKSNLEFRGFSASVVGEEVYVFFL